MKGALTVGLFFSRHTTLDDLGMLSASSLYLSHPHPTLPRPPLSFQIQLASLNSKLTHSPTTVLPLSILSAVISIIFHFDFSHALSSLIRLVTKQYISLSFLLIISAPAWFRLIYWLCIRLSFCDGLSGLLTYCIAYANCIRMWAFVTVESAMSRSTIVYHVVSCQMAWSDRAMLLEQTKSTMQHGLVSVCSMY